MSALIRCIFFPIGTWLAWSSSGLHARSASTWWLSIDWTLQTHGSLSRVNGTIRCARNNASRSPILSTCWVGSRKCPSGERGFARFFGPLLHTGGTAGPLPKLPMVGRHCVGCSSYIWTELFSRSTFAWHAIEGSGRCPGIVHYFSQFLLAQLPCANLDAKCTLVRRSIDRSDQRSAAG